jgi:hypothetical protein
LLWLLLLLLLLLWLLRWKACSSGGSALLALTGALLGLWQQLCGGALPLLLCAARLCRLLLVRDLEGVVVAGRRGGIGYRRARR